MSELEMGPEDIKKAIRRHLTRCWDLETLLVSIEQECERRVTASPEQARYIEQAQDWLGALRRAMDCGDLRKSVTLALKLGATAERAGIQGVLDRWHKQADVAKGLGKERWEVKRLVDSGALRTNGKTGHRCRIDPQSVLDYCQKTGVAWNDM